MLVLSREKVNAKLATLSVLDSEEASEISEITHMLSRFGRVDLDTSLDEHTGLRAKVAWFSAHYHQMLADAEVSKARRGASVLTEARRELRDSMAAGGKHLPAAILNSGYRNTPWADEEYCRLALVVNEYAFLDELFGSLRFVVSGQQDMLVEQSINRRLVEKVTINDY